MNKDSKQGRARTNAARDVDHRQPAGSLGELEIEAIPPSAAGLRISEEVATLLLENLRAYEDLGRTWIAHLSIVEARARGGILLDGQRQEVVMDDLSRGQALSSLLARLVCDRGDEYKSNPQSGRSLACWRVLQLRYVDGLTNKEIAKQLPASEKTVQRMCRTGANLLQSVLFELLD